MNVSRRSLLKGFGAAAAIASPFISFLNRPLQADGDHNAKRMVIFFSPNGSILEHWRPTGTETSFSFPAGSILEPLESWKERMLVIDGLDFKGATNHEGGMAAMLTGGGGSATMTGGRSLDIYVAEQLAADTRFQNIPLGVQTSAWGASIQTRMGYNGDGSFVSPWDRTQDAFGRVFGMASSTPSDMDLSEMRQQSVLDAVRGELGALQRELGSEERIKLDAHLDSIRQLESRLMVGGGGCGTPPAGTVSNAASQQNENFPMVMRNQIDLMVAALACDATRVATLQCSHTVSPTVPSWLDISEGHHALSHMSDSNVAGVQQFVQAERWFAEQFRYLLERLDATPDMSTPGSSMLDTTAVFWPKEMGDSRLHVCESVPFVIAGAGNHFNLGRYLQFPGGNHQKILVSMCHAMGLMNPTFGDPSHGTGPLAGLTV